MMSQFLNKKKYVLSITITAILQFVGYLVLYRSKKNPLESDCSSICKFAGTICLQISIQKHTILFLLAFLSYSLPFSQKPRSAVGRGMVEGTFMTLLFA
jgi:hypothetical protein